MLNIIIQYIYQNTGYLNKRKCPLRMHFFRYQGFNHPGEHDVRSGRGVQAGRSSQTKRESRYR